MTVEQWLTIILSVAAIALTICGIVFTIFYGRDSSRNSQEASGVLQNVKVTADTVNSDIRNITGQFVNSFTRLLLERAGQGWITQMCYPNYEVTSIEQNVRQGSTIYVLVVTMDYEVGQFKHVIVDNLRQGKKYVYFLPEDMPAGYQNEADRFINTLKASGVPEETLKKNLEIRKVTSAEILCNVTLFDPEVGEKQGFILPAYESAERAFSVKLDNTLHDRAWARVQAWRREEGSKIIWPPTDHQSEG